MGYLDNTSVTVDAVLTKKGREILSRGGNLNIGSFTCSDTGIDYTLWNPDHPSGSAFYGEAIENLPMLEAGVHAEYALNNRLMTFSQNTIALPAIEFSGLTSTNQLKFENGDTGGLSVVVTIKNYASNAGNSSGLYFVIEDPNIIYSTATSVAGLSGTLRNFVLEQDIPNAQMYEVTGLGPDYTIPFMPNTDLLTSGKETQVTVVHKVSGAFGTFKLKNNVTRLTRNVMSTLTKG